MIKLNTQIAWNTTYDYTCTSYCNADGAKVMRHELGHGEGLAHVAAGVTAIMVQGDPGSNYHLIKQDDKNGIIHIYGAYP